jgi:uncharacterized membrane protein YfcA
VFDLPIIATFAAGVLATSFLSGIFGMAGGMVLMGLLLWIMPLPAAMTLHGITQMASNGWRAWLWRSHIRWPIALRFAAGSVGATAAFGMVAAVPSKGAALLLLGLTPFIGLLLPARARLNVARPVHAVACGGICGTLQLVAGVSGPILDTFFIQAGLDRRGIVATKATVQTLGHALKILYFGALLALGGDGIPPAIAVLAVVLALIGTHGARRVLDVMTDAQFRLWSRRIIVAVSAVYVWQGALMLYRGG